jgi:hypothetical protein
MASASFRRAWLGRVYRSRETSGRTLIDALNYEVDTRSAAVESGQVISSVEANGNKVDFSTTDNAGISQVGIVEIASQMVELYESAQSYLLALNGTDPDDAAIYAQMNARLRQRVNRYSDSFLLLRHRAPAIQP